MNVEAERDDGALLVTDGPAALVVLDGRAWPTSRESALARGSWKPSSAPVPQAARDSAPRLTELRQDLQRQATALEP